MDIGTEHADRIVNVGSASNLYSLYSTAVALMGRKTKKVRIGLSFLENGTCNLKDCSKALKQLIVIQDELAKHEPNDAVWDIDHPNIRAPWEGNLAPTATSCADLHTTAEGDLLLPQLILLLQYANLTKQGIVVLG